MRLLLVRHGEAEESERNRPDALRRLTKRGREELKGVSRGIRAFFPTPDLICSSPLLRAQETAAFIVEAFGGKVRVETLSLLLPEAAPEDFRDWLVCQPRESAIIAVGHQPHLGLLISLLVTRGRRSMVEPKKASATLLAIGDPFAAPAELVWTKEAAELQSF